MSHRAKTTRYYRLGVAPYMPLPLLLIFTDRKEATRRARDENRCGTYRGRGVKVYRCDQDGRLIVEKAAPLTSTRVSDYPFPPQCPEDVPRWGTVPLEPES